MPKRHWKLNSDSNAVHAIGNGRILVYEKGPQIFQILSYPLSANSFGELTVENIDYCESERIDGTDIFEHKIGNGTIMYDLADSATNCFVRKIKTDSPQTLKLNIDRSYIANGTQYIKQKGSVMFFCYMSPSAELSRSFGTSGNIEVHKINDYEWEFICQKGVSYIYFADSEQSIENQKQIDFEVSFKRTSEFWNEYLSNLKNIPESIKPLCESVAVMIKVQQSEDGGVLAGYPYHLAYIRDQYGTARGLLKLGLTDSVKDILKYYLEIFNEHGTLHNAQSLGVHDVFHIHENDAAEITGYVALMPFEVYEADGDADFLNQMLPIVRWAIDSQISLLKNNMMPFNGDETYIAGHFLPRSCMYDGSMEATMLLAEDIKRYQKYTNSFEYNCVLEGIEKTFCDNFIKDGNLITNNLTREDYSTYPAKRLGVCEGCEGYFGRINKTDTHRYICPNCEQSGNIPPKREEKNFSLASSLLTSVYVGSTLLPTDILYAKLDELVEQYHKTGVLPSGCANGECVGYDYGFLLYAATVLKHPSAHEFYKIALDSADEIGVWSEYYKNGVPYNTRCRPWESAINIEAILKYLESF